jgi:GT2 family glycosyltransferase
MVFLARPTAEHPAETCRKPEEHGGNPLSHEVKATPRPSAKFFYTGAPASAPSDGLGLDGALVRQKFFVRGVTYGTFAPNDRGGYPSPSQVAVDFARMREANINTLRIYTEPPAYLLDEAHRHGLQVIVGLAWTQHVCFLDDPSLAQSIRESVRESVRRLKDHPAVFAIALGNEIPAAIVRWHGKEAIEQFLHDLYLDVKAEAPRTLCTYVNFPPTDYLDLPFLDFVCFNVFLHDVANFRSYMAKLQHIAGNRPLVLSEVGMDSIREGEEAQAEFLNTHLRAAFADGAAGVCVFSFTDDWWRGGSQVTDWSFGLVDAERRPKPAFEAVRKRFLELPFAADEQADWPKVSVVICAYNAASTLEDNLSSLERLEYPNYEVIVVNDGSTDATAEIASRYPFRQITVPNGGLSAARNLGLHAATGEIVAYTDSDTRVDAHWLSHLVQPFLESNVGGVGGPNVVPPDDGWIAQCVARSPGGPVHVMLDNTEAEHIPGCNMAFRKLALEAIGGFDPTYVKAGDDVDVCWRLQEHGHTLGFAPGALVWHHHRDSVKAYWKQQVGYGEGESFLQHRHTDRFNDRGHVRWAGRIYSPLPAYRSLFRQVVYQGRFGCEAFPSIYQGGLSLWGALPQMVEWQVLTAIMLISSVLVPWLLVPALLALTATVIGCVRHAWASKIDDVAEPSRALRFRLMILWLHFVQPWARVRGRVKGYFSDANYTDIGRALLTSAPRLLPLDTLRLMFFHLDKSLWDTHYTPIDAVLSGLRKRSAGALTPVRCDDGFSAGHDVVLRAGRTYAFKLKLTAEDHGGLNRLFRVRICLDRPWFPMFVVFGTLMLFTTYLIRLRFALGSFVVPEGLIGLLVLGALLYRVSRHGGQVLHALQGACGEYGITALGDTTPPREADQHRPVLG